ncbi:MAG: ABC transporter permease [Candidatus Hodarchaeota archaeon]
MGKFKLLMKSIVFSTRSRRRFFTFVIIFGLLSGATIQLLTYFDNFSRQELLNHKGVVVKAADLDSVNLATAQTDLNVQDGERLPGSEIVIFYKYVNFGASFRIFSMNSRYPWAFSEIKPNNLIAGSFPNSDNEVLVSEDAFITVQDNQDGVRIYTKPVVGTTLKLGGSVDSDFDLRVSGVYRKPSSIQADFEQNGREWIILTENAFAELLNEENLGYTNDNQIWVHSITIIAAGSILDVYSGACYSRVDELGSSLEQDINPNADYDNVDYTPKANKEESRNLAFLSLVFGLIGTFIVSTLYAYIITRFRRREVAVLKAMGYNKWDVRIVVLSEILVVSITGFILGLLTIQSFLFLTKQGSWFFMIIFSQTALLSFLAVVLSTIPGFFLISFRILSVRPIEIFRQK